jgi:hypothetical protein
MTDALRVRSRAGTGLERTETLRTKATWVRRGQAARIRGRETAALEVRPEDQDLDPAVLLTAGGIVGAVGVLV